MRLRENESGQRFSAYRWPSAARHSATVAPLKPDASFLMEMIPQRFARAWVIGWGAIGWGRSGAIIRRCTDSWASWAKGFGANRLGGQRASLTKILPVYRGHHVITVVLHVITAVLHVITALFVSQVVYSPRPCCEHCVVERCWDKLFRLGTADLCKSDLP